MKNRVPLTVALGVCMVFVMGQSQCPIGNLVLLDQTVAVDGGGGFVDVSFHGTAGQHVVVSMTGVNTMEPYGFLTYPSGSGEDAPPNNTAHNGMNSVMTTLPETGMYTLTVFDGANQGGMVHVQVVLQP